MNKQDGSLISVIICTLNRSHLLPRSVNSVLGQTHHNLEVIVVDDGSSPEHATAIAKSEITKDPRVKLIQKQHQEGVSKSTNLGSRNARGSYIALLGDDDYWTDAKKLEKQLLLLRDQGTVGVVGTYWITDYGSHATTHQPKLKENIKARMLAGGGIICGSTPLIPRYVWEQVGGLDEKMHRGTDSDLFRRICLANYGVHVIPEVTTYVDAIKTRSDRITPVQTHEQIKKALASHWYVTKKYYRSYLCHPTALAVRLRNMSKLAVKYISRR